MTNLSDLLPAGGSGKSVKLIASGALANGDKVVLQSDGTVKVVVGNPLSAGNAVTIQNAGSSHFACVYDSVNDKIVIIFRDKGNSSYGAAFVGTVSGTSISFGTEVVFNSGYVYYCTALFDSYTGKIIITYQENANNNAGTAKVGTVSGTSISFGSASVFNPGSQSITASGVDTSNNKIVIGYRDNGNGGYGTAVIGTVSGTSISFGSEVVFDSGGANVEGVVFDSNSGNMVFTYQSLNTAYPQAIIGTVSGTSISFGGSVVINSSSGGEVISIGDPSTNKIVCAYAGGNISHTRVGTVSGTSISFGPEINANTYGFAHNFSFNSQSNKIIMVFRDSGSSPYGKITFGTVSGTSITWETPIYFSGDFVSAQNPQCAYDSTNNKIVTAFSDSYGGLNDIARCSVVDPGGTNLTATSFLGTSEGAFSDTDTATVMLRGGITTTQSGLTTGSKYYVQGDGTLSTSAGSPSVTAGKALSATTLLIGGSS